MGEARSAAMTRIALELERLGQEVSATQHVLGDAGSNGPEEIGRRLRHIAARANRIAATVENARLM
jgi:hypothetical protein